MFFYPTRLKRLSIRTKLSTTGFIAVIFLLAILGSITFWSMKRDMVQGVNATQTALVDTVAAGIDQSVTTRLRDLTLTASVLSGPSAPTLAILQKHFIERPAFRAHFDTILVSDTNGVVVYDYPEIPGRRGVSIKHRDYYTSIMANKKPAVSAPAFGKVTNQPNINLAVPILSPTGEVLGILSGVMYLDMDNFITAVTKTPVGRNGYMALFTSGAKPVVLAHPEKKHVLGDASAKTVSPSMVLAARGFDGTTEAANSAGHKSFYSFKHLATAPWVLMAVYPSEEAYATLNSRVPELIGVGFLFALCAGLLIRWWISSLLNPLKKLTDEMQQQILNPQRSSRKIHANSSELTRVVDMYDLLSNQSNQARRALAYSEQRMRDILTHAGDAFVSLDENGLITEWNHQAEETFGWTREQVLHQPLTDLIIPENYREAHARGMAGFSATGEGPVINKRIEITALHKDGHIIPIELSVTAEKKDNGKYGANAFIRDITERKEAAQKLSSSEERLRTITDNLPILISYIDKHQILRFCNKTYGTWSGTDMRDMLNHHAVEALGGEGYALRKQYIERALAGERVQFELDKFTAGEPRILSMDYLPDVAMNGEVQGIYTLGMDITSIKRAEQELQLLARHDTLTGLANRLQINEKLDEAIRRHHRSKQPLAVLFLDLDYFKAINDTLGHQAGDDVLVEVSQRLASAVRSTDTVSRLGGDEFVVLLENLHFIEEAEFVAKKIIDSIVQPMTISGQPLTLSTSIGVAMLDAEPSTSSALLSKADDALYEAKRKGKNCYCVARDED